MGPRQRDTEAGSRLATQLAPRPRESMSPTVYASMVSSLGRDAHHTRAASLADVSAALARGAMVLAGVLVLVTLAFESLADPARARLGPSASEAAVVALRRELALDAPFSTRVGAALSRQLWGDLGRSIALDRPVSELVAEAWANTLVYAIPGATLAFLGATGLALALWPTPRRGWGARLEIGLTGLTAVSGVVIAAWLQRMFGMLGAPITALSLRDATLPAAGGLGGLVLHAIPPVVTWALLLLPSDLRIQRAALAVQEGAPWPMGLRARGLSEARIATHVLVHALPVIASRGLQRLPQLACGSVAVEAVFDVPGLGQLMLLALRSGDVVLAQGLVIAIAIPLVLARTAIAISTPTRGGTGEPPPHSARSGHTTAVSEVHP